MLVLTRKQNEKIRIGDQITITVLRMKGKSVRLGIQAPADINVVRGELTFHLSTAEDNLPKGSETAIGERKASQPSKHGSTKSSSQALPRTDRWPLKKHNERALANPARGTETSPGPLQTRVQTNTL